MPTTKTKGGKIIKGEKNKLPSATLPKSYRRAVSSTKAVKARKQSSRYRKIYKSRSKDKIIQLPPHLKRMLTPIKEDRNLSIIVVDPETLKYIRTYQKKSLSTGRPVSKIKYFHIKDVKKPKKKSPAPKKKPVKKASKKKSKIKSLFKRLTKK